MTRYITHILCTNGITKSIITDLQRFKIRLFRFFGFGGFNPFAVLAASFELRS